MPGSSLFGCPSMKLSISMRELKAAPCSGKNTPLLKEPPLGVAHTRFPSRSMQAICVVPLLLPDSPAPTPTGICAVPFAGLLTPEYFQGSPAAGSSGQARSGSICPARSTAYSFEIRPSIGTVAKFGSP